MHELNHKQRTGSSEGLTDAKIKRFPSHFLNNQMPSVTKML